MPGAQIAVNQAANSVPYGTPGFARDDIWQSQPVACVSTLSGNVSYSWVFLDLPPGSAATLSDATTATATFDPDLLGTYRIQLTTNGGGLGNVKVLVIRVLRNSAGTVQSHGLCLPAFGELAAEDNVGSPPNARGYAPLFELMLAYVLTLSSGGGGGGPAAPTVISATGNLAIPAVNTTYLVQSTADITTTFTGTPTDGLELTFIDGLAAWLSFSYTLVPQSPGLIGAPGIPGGRFSSTTLSNNNGAAGLAITFIWSSLDTAWIPKSVNYQAPPFVLWYLGGDDVSASGGGTFASDWPGDAFPQEMLIYGTPGGVVNYEISAGYAWVCLFNNQTSVSVNIVSAAFNVANSYTWVSIPPGGAALVSTDGTNVFSCDSRYPTLGFDSCQAGGTVVSSFAQPPTYLVLGGTPGAPFVYQFSTQPFLTQVSNGTTQPVALTNGTTGGSTQAMVPPFSSLLVRSDGTWIIAVGEPVLDDANPVDILFDMETSGACVVTPGTTPLTAPLTIPLPQTVPGSPIIGGAPGLLTLDVSVRMQSTSTVDAAWFKLSWAWTVQNLGSPQALGAATPLLSLGNSVATPQTAPVGWGVTLQLDGGQQNVQIIIAGDPSLTVDCAYSAKWGNLQ